MDRTNRKKPKPSNVSSDQESADNENSVDVEDDFGPRIIEPLDEMPIAGMSPKQVAGSAKNLMETKKSETDQGGEEE